MAADKLEGQMDFLGLIEEYVDDQGAKVRVKTPTARKPRAVKKSEVVQFKLDFLDLDAEFEAEKVPEQAEEKVQKQVEDKQEELPVETVKEKSKAEKPAKTSEPGEPTELLFKQCKRCWCRDCKHNSRNDGIPREMCGMMIPCPACTGCIEEDMATICEIGNAKEGCKLRAEEEGILVNEDYSEF